TPAPVVDSSRDSLLQTDRDFAASALTEGVVAAYDKYLAADAVQLPDGALPLDGKEAIMANVLGAVADNEFSLSWEPVNAEVAASGDLGYTWGNYFLEGIDIDGASFEAEGKYASVWRYSSDSGWQVVLDISNDNEMLFPEELDFGLLTEDFGADSAATD
ncbi:MAG: DUF4440 domain-containing protein, partial [Gammaproteobacteria bacterium]|nr:DUF4440 domain-containing protein [Gammaproteobacteria bacterium]